MATVAERKPDAGPGIAPDLGGTATGALLAAAAEAGGDVLLLAGDEAEAESWVAVMAAFAPDAFVATVPASEASGGSPDVAVAGHRRVAARALAARDRPRAILVATAEAALSPAPHDDGEAFPAIRAGQPIDADALLNLLNEAGYFADDRVDEPGEYAIRGQVADLFPVDAARPMRIEFGEDRVQAIRRFDPITQLGAEEVESVVVVPIRPERAGQGSFANLLHDPQVAGRAALPKAVLQWPRLQVPAAEEGTRFVERRQASRAFAAAVRKAREAGDRVILAGSARDLRFLAARARRMGEEAPEEVGDWKAAANAPAGAFVSLVAPLDGGWRAPGLLVVAAADLLGGRAGSGEGTQPLDTFFGSSIQRGDVVIHEAHGVAVVQGLEAVEADGATQDALRLEHARGAVRLVPVDEMNRVWRYGAEADAVSLDRLDGSSWEERRAGIDAAIAESARALVQLAAEREDRTAATLAPPRDRIERFAAGFGHPLTTGQRAAVEAVEADLASGRPMDRLVVGDVGYGKTEVALRAAALAVLAGKQVAIAAPTTVLVRQHLETFRRRFEPLGVRVASLSRLTDAAEARETKAGLADGSVGIVIGTQAIAGGDVEYQSLALVVIDEEQRFGAKDKLKLRGLAPDAHVLTLTATPIPRTLQTALVGLQQLSLITSPPARRQPIGTNVAPWDADQVAAALRREKARGGQSFMVVPQIADMEGRAAELARIVPELKIVQAHGRMPAAEIDAAMVGFADGEGDVLLATNIIEAGLDVPRANTMVVWRADRFGLSQLHQLRGRVGRGGRRGAVLLTTEEGAEIAPATLKRLRTLEAFDRLGAGFEISARDLDLRGAGDLLGEEQAGHMQLVGVDLYQHLFALAVRAARGEAVEDWQPELHIGLVGRLPEAWLPDEDLRIEFYGRIARAEDAGAVDRLAEEMEDRFGALPPEAETTLDLARLRLLARATGVARIDAGPGAIALTPHGKTDWSAVDALVEKKGRWILSERIEDPRARLARTTTLLEELAGE